MIIQNPPLISKSGVFDLLHGYLWIKTHIKNRDKIEFASSMSFELSPQAPIV
jgi:hypothetical protein